MTWTGEKFSRDFLDSRKLPGHPGTNAIHNNSGWGVRWACVCNLSWVFLAFKARLDLREGTAA